jgi:hypothetical protein
MEDVPFEFSRLFVPIHWGYDEAMKTSQELVVEWEPITDADAVQHVIAIFELVLDQDEAVDNSA